MKKEYVFYYTGDDGFQRELGRGTYKQPMRSTYYRVLDNWLNRGVITSYRYEVINSDEDKYFCLGCGKEIPIVIDLNHLHLCGCGTLNNIGDAD